MASAALAALAAAVLFTLCLKGQYLMVGNQLSGQTRLCLPAENGSQFAVSFTHSVNKSPVIEYYRVEDGQIYLSSLRYYSFGAGMPTEPEQGQTMRYEDGAIIIDNFNRPMPYLCYNIGRIAGHTLHHQGREIPLNSLDQPGQPLSFSIISYPRLLILLKHYPTIDS